MSNKDDDSEDFARYRRTDDGKYEVVMAVSRKKLIDDLTLMEAAEFVRNHNKPKARGW